MHATGNRFPKDPWVDSDFLNSCAELILGLVYTGLLPLQRLIYIQKNQILCNHRITHYTSWLTLDVAGGQTTSETMQE
jgi:hypothetical protein